ncbi:MAG: hypothetical protein JWP12_2570 [Bacteroidetes bacterium]|nr:hypothetical protein [Bacteroidota bacterium]
MIMKKQLKKIFLGTLLLLGSISGKAQTQLSKWQVNTSDYISFTSSTPAYSGPNTFPLNVVYNSISDNAGNIIFSVIGQSVRNAAGTVIGTLPILYRNTEIAIVPNPGNFTNACQKKYYIIYPRKNVDTEGGYMAYAEVDMNAASGAGTLTLVTSNIGVVTNPVNPMAVSRVNANGKRYLYFLSGSQYNISICEISATAITPLNTSAYTVAGNVTQCNEMELSNAGDKLAFINTAGALGKYVIVVPINPATGLSSGSPSSITVTGNVNGLEFDASGNKLFFSKPGSGVYVEDLSTSAVTAITGTTAFGSGMLEKTFSGSTQYIACASATGLVGFIDPSTATLNSSLNISYQLSNNMDPGYTIVLMPDQIDGENYASVATILFPSFTVPASICSGNLITVNGLASYGTINGNVVTSPSPIGSYTWTLVESNAAGTPVTGATVWSSPAYTGAPGYFTFPDVSAGGPTISCGKYYCIKIRLMNSCIIGIETQHVVYVNCLPTVTLTGSSQYICNGSSGTLAASINSPDPGHTYTLTWTYITIHHGLELMTTLYSGAPGSVNVSPTTNTTYYGTITDNVTGCSTSFTWTVNIVNDNPSFSISTNTADTNYYTITATANDLSQFSLPGFNYIHLIEELDGSGNPLYPAEWPGGPWLTGATQHFAGFVGLAITPFYSQDPAGTYPAQGQFLYFHTYRITRGVLDDYCSYRQTSVTITTAKSLEDGKPTIIITEDKNAPDYSYLMTNHTAAVAPVINNDELNVYPNPGTGVFTIETNSADKSSIEIYDVLGNRVKAFEQNGFKSTVDLSGYPKGMYMINVITNGKKVSKKIILE